MEGGWKNTGYWTLSLELTMKWISILIEKNINFWMTARKGEYGEVYYILQTAADKDMSKKLIEEYGFCNEYPCNEKES